MKYLVKTKRRASVQAVADVMRTTKQYVNDELSSGRADCVYLFASGDGSGLSTESS
jgi:hypothetical protein